jgi:peptidoglycan/LPS O-acetylase OafA/YrhL
MRLDETVVPQASSSRLIHLDMVRGLAALAVVAGHLRGFLFVDYGALEQPGLAHNALYFLTGFGHQAVIVFFALSGYLVGGRALKDMLSGAWSGSRYMVARLSRLWTVAIPALGLTLILDVAGRALGAGAGYDGTYWDLLSSGPTLREPADNSFATFLANVFFLQTIVAPAYGTNGPLWSLAYEFWYYALFPLAASAIFTSQAAWQRLSAIVAAAAMACLLPRHLLLLGAIWVAGAIANHLTTLASARRLFRSTTYLCATALSAAVCSVVLRLHTGTVAHDLLLGGVWALFLPALVALPPWGEVYARVATLLSEMSYTLYATHFPLLSFLWFTALAPTQFAPGLFSIALGLALLSSTLLYAGVIWWCFERHTGKVRSKILAMLEGPMSSVFTTKALVKHR